MGVLKRIAILTSGGDAPGMNACVRASVRTAIYDGIEVFGIYSGFEGLINGDIIPLNRRSVSNMIQKGGTFLKTSRSEAFRHKSGRKRAAENLIEWEIDGLIIIGGDGSFRGTHDLYEESGIQVVGIPATIDNDIYGTDLTIGYDTAVNTALDSIDKIRDTAASHDRLFVVEVMGRNAGFIALEVGICGGAEEILVPETKVTLEDLGNLIKTWAIAGKTSSLIVVAEGDELGNAHEIADKLYQKYHTICHVCVLGHTQRGGSPTATDRLLASRLGYHAVKALEDGKTDIMVGWVNNSATFIPLPESWEKKKPLDAELIKIYRILST
ncbi:MAG TPA: 6-phosphofructokinase [Candidatus Marinimicrobia bacterium]|nr:6-phosphofructokinase [Candidatus Neomarinimicrobiota bacterium]HRS52418.1 6-phosphofructokinase [Candidatus Neomarinimicrobiota bacterium]